ncbi:MAG: hypothetical protein WCC14_20595 [Acidobacteriaceae bacterium]
MTRTLWALLLACSATFALAQANNTVYVRKFLAPNGTVGQAVTAAQATCDPSTVCTVVFDPSLVPSPAGSMPEKCARCIWQDYRTGSGVPGSGIVARQITKLSRVDVAYPDFSFGQPIKGIAVGNGSCTSNATITVSAPAYSQDGTQAIAVGYCVNGTLKPFIRFPGGGYTSAATVTITGGGTSGAAGTVVLVGAAGQADPTGTNDSSSAILNAVDYAQTYGAANRRGGTEPGATPLVYIPKGTYKLLDTVRVPCDLHVAGDGENATILEPATDSENALTFYPGVINARDNWVYSGSLTDLSIGAIGGHRYQATELELQSCGADQYDHVRIYGGGGRGMETFGAGAERQEASNIEIDAVRWPLLWAGNENHLRKLNIAAPGMSSDNYCWSVADCVNGVYPNYRWTDGKLVSASGNGTRASFYVIGKYAGGSGDSPSTSPLVAGHTFTVGGTSNLDGTYTVTAVRNNVARDPSGNCTPSHECFEVQAASAVRGDATLGVSTTATFARGAYVMTVASATGFDPGAFIRGAGIPAMTRVVAARGVTITVDQAFTASESEETVAVAAGWWPTLLSTNNAAVFLHGADVVVEDGSIKSLWYAGAFDVEGVFGSRIQSFYLEGYPVNGMPTLNSSLREGNLPPETTLTGTLSQTSCNSQSNICPVPVASTLWFYNYVNDPMDIIGFTLNSAGAATIRLLPPDYIYGSTAASVVGNGVRKGQWEDVSAIFAGDGKMYVVARNLSTSTAPSGTSWPSGSLVVLDPQESTGANMGSLLYADNHGSAIDGPGNGWWYNCVDNSRNPCASILAGTIPNDMTTFTYGQRGSSAGVGANITSLDNEIWGTPFSAGNEPLGNSYIKVVGRSGNITVLSGVIPGWNSYDQSFQAGELLQDGFVNVRAADGTCPPSQYRNLDENISWNNATGSCNGWGIKTFAPLTADPDTGAALGSYNQQFVSSYCSYDTGATSGAHATMRFCLLGGPANPAKLEWDTWSGSAWTPAEVLTRSGLSLLGGHTYSRHTIVTALLQPDSVAANTCAPQSATVRGLASGDHVINRDVVPRFLAGLALDGVLVTGSNTVSLNFCNNTSRAITPPSGTYTFDVEQ